MNVNVLKIVFIILSQVKYSYLDNIKTSMWVIDDLISQIMDMRYQVFTLVNSKRNDG